ncbi:MAG: VOC family protein [Armatimonadota bacterium]|nr:VOC family protein [Armatimonadota bacterium]
MSANRVVKGLGFHHAAVQTHRYEETKRFYTEVLGCRLRLEWEMGERKLALLDLGDGGHIEVIGVPASPNDAPAKQAPMIHLALRVEDVDAAVARVRAAGCPVTVEPKDVTLGSLPVRVAFFQGVNGEVLEFFQEKA